MRRSILSQGRLDCSAVASVKLNMDCRDEIIPILRGLQHIYSQPALRDEILQLVTSDVNRNARTDRGRMGLGHWQILVLAAVRLGCNLDYDKLQDLAEQHRTLRQIMGVGDWEEETTFSWRRIRDNVCLIQPGTIEKIYQLVASAGHDIEPTAIEKVRADSFVIETNIHHPTESSLIVDGVRKVLEFATRLSEKFGLAGWRQHAHLLKEIKKCNRLIGRHARGKSKQHKDAVKQSYQDLLRRARAVLDRAVNLSETLKNECTMDAASFAEVGELDRFLALTRKVCSTTYRRVVLDENVPNAEKLFSIFEEHTQLYQRGKTNAAIQFGRLALVCEDQLGFIVHHHLLPRDACDSQVIVEQIELLQNRVGHNVKELSLDAGFHSIENQERLKELVPSTCLPAKSPKQAAEQMKNANVEFRQARKRHPGVESAIGAMQAGNGLKRSRDRSLIGFERYLALGLLGRNIHTLGKLLIRKEHPDCEAAHSRRHAA